VRGRRPKPVEQHRRRGTDRPDRHGLTPVLVAGRPEPGSSAPADLFPEAAELWELIVPPLVEVGLVDRVDAFTLASMCTLGGRVLQARKALLTEPLVVKGDRGLVVSPWLRIERDSIRAFFSMAEHFGLTPVARARLGLAELKRRTLAEELAGALGLDDLIDPPTAGELPAAGDEAPVEVCAECGTAKGRRHDLACSRSRARRGT
jgi:P27 family predicted phage terminase small subunit